MTRSTLARLFGALMLVVVAVTLLVISAHALSVRVEYDEAYNLQIAESLRAGRGYASFGVLGSGEPWRFDPHITTGPVVLLPAAAVWNLSGGSITATRGVLLAFLLAYVLGWWLLMRGTRPGGWVVASVALAPALAVAGSAAGRVLGEMPGAALLVWAAAALARKRPALAALAIGLAIQTKIVYGLGGAVMLAVWLVLSMTSGDRLRLRTLIAIALLAAIPSLLFEFARFQSLGSLEEYLKSVGELRQFMAGQKIPDWLDPTTIGAKVSGLLGSYPLHAWIALSVAALALLAGNALVSGKDGESAPDAVDGPQPLVTALVALLASGIALLFGWLTQSSQTGVRQALPFFLLSVPALMALCLVRCLRFLPASRDQTPGRMPTALVASGAVLLSVSMVLTLADAMQRTMDDEYAQASAAEQREVTETIRELRPGSLYAKGFWHNPEYLLLSQVPGVGRRTYDRQLLVVQDYQVALSSTSWADHESKCGEVVRKTQFTLVCWMPEAPTKELFRIVDWGPKASPAGTLPLPQPGGGSAVWFKIAPVIPEDTGPVRIHIGKVLVDGVLSPKADLISGVVPAAVFAQPGVHEVVLEQVVTERRMRVGEIQVGPP